MFAELAKRHSTYNYTEMDKPQTLLNREFPIAQPLETGSGKVFSKGDMSDH